MSRPGKVGGWTWFDPPTRPKPEQGDDGAEARKIARTFARCFAGSEAETVLGYLRAMTRDRTLGPRASDAALRHLEGQRGLVQHIEAMIARGRG